MPKTLRPAYKPFTTSNSKPSLLTSSFQISDLKPRGADVLEYQALSPTSPTFRKVHEGTPFGSPSQFSEAAVLYQSSDEGYAGSISKGRQVDFKEYDTYTYGVYRPAQRKERMAVRNLGMQKVTVRRREVSPSDILFRKQSIGSHSEDKKPMKRYVYFSIYYLQVNTILVHMLKLSLNTL